MSFNRECGECSECCTALEVSSIAKRAHVRCDKLSQPGCCSIYDTRPYECQIFHCLWLAGFGKVSERPDKSGIVAHLSLNKMADMVAVNVVESREGAFEQSPSIMHRARALRAACVQFEHFDGRVTIYSEDAQYIQLVGMANDMDIPDGTRSIEMELRHES